MKRYSCPSAILAFFVYAASAGETRQNLQSVLTVKTTGQFELAKSFATNSVWTDSRSVPVGKTNITVDLVAESSAVSVPGKERELRRSDEIQLDPLLIERWASMQVGSQNVWNLLYYEGTLETLIDETGFTGKDVYNGDLYRFDRFRRRWSIGLDVESGFLTGNSGIYAVGYTAGLYIKLKF